MIKINHKTWRYSALTTALVMALACTQTQAQTLTSPVPAMTLAPSSLQFVFGDAKSKVTGTKIDANLAYDAARGYGFRSTPQGNEAAFSVKVPPGDYLVTAVIGDKTKPSRTTLWAEERRLMVAPVVLKKGETRTVTFRVNVRDATLTPDVQDGVPYPHVILRADDADSRDWDDQLTISISGSAPALSSLTIAPVTGRRVLIAGDSTVTDQGGRDYASWGQMLPRFLGADVAVANHARSGETMKGFMTSLRWDKLMSETRPGDVVLIQFGHNDEKKQWPHTYAAAIDSSGKVGGAYPAYLSAMVADVRQHGALPVVISPVQRLGWGADGKIVNSHVGYDQAVRDVAANLKVPVIDLTTETAKMYEALGPQLAPMAFANGGKEKTHHAAYGAYMIACFVTQELTRADLGLKGAADLPACTPDKPDDPRTYALEAGDWPLMHPAAVVTQKAEVTPLK